MTDTNNIQQGPTSERKLSMRGQLAANAIRKPDISRADLEAFFGPRWEVYLDIYEKRVGHRPLFSWPALLFGPAWFIYRKMYVFGSLLIVILILLLPIFREIFFFAVVGPISAGANNLYVAAATLRISKADKLGLMGEERIAYLNRKGGVSVIGGIIGGVLWAYIIWLTVLLALHWSPPGT